MTALKAKLPNPPTKVKTDQIMPLRHNFTGQVMQLHPGCVNGKAPLIF
jgi:hypothetical protein